MAHDVLGSAFDQYRARVQRHESICDGGDERHLLFAPLFHANALVYSFLASLWAGCTAVVQPRFSKSRFWDVATRNRCTWASTPGFAVRALLDQPVPPHDFRHWGVGAGDLPHDERPGVRTLGWWEMTETVATPIASDLDVPNTPWSMGRPRPEYGIRIVDAEGLPVRPGETGHLQVRGTRGVPLFAGYLHDEQATAAAFDDGWFSTGDLVTHDDTGAITFSGRAKDMLKVGGENVAESEIERVIASVPGVREVAVVGAPDPMLDEVPVAYVLAEPGAPAALPQIVIARCSEALADLKVPRQVMLVDDLPRSLLGKVAKTDLRSTASGGRERPPATGE